MNPTVIVTRETLARRKAGCLSNIATIVPPSIRQTDVDPHWCHHLAHHPPHQLLPAAPRLLAKLEAVAATAQPRSTLAVAILSYMTWTPNPPRLEAVRSTRQQREQRDVAVPVTASKRTLMELQRKDESQPKHHPIRPETSPVINLTPVNMRCFIQHFVEPHAVQIQTARFWQHLQTAAAAAPAHRQQVQLDPVKRWKSTKSQVWCPSSPLVSTLWLLLRRLIRAMFRPVEAGASPSPPPPPPIPAVAGRPRLRPR